MGDAVEGECSDAESELDGKEDVDGTRGPPTLRDGGEGR